MWNCLKDSKNAELTYSQMRREKDRDLLWSGNSRRTKHIFRIKLTLEERVFSYQSPYLQRKVLEVPLSEVLVGKLLEYVNKWAITNYKDSAIFTQDFWRTLFRSEIDELLRVVCDQPWYQRKETCQIQYHLAMQISGGSSFGFHSGQTDREKTKQKTKNQPPQQSANK